VCEEGERGREEGGGLKERSEGDRAKRRVNKKRRNDLRDDDCEKLGEEERGDVHSG
jgi:hypothetical protein